MNLNDYQQQAMTTRKYPQDRALDYLVPALTGEAGELANKWAKCVRDGDGIPVEEMAYELGDVFWMVAVLAYELGFNLDSIARLNLEKLADRAQRNVIGGSGDHR